MPTPLYVVIECATETTKMVVDTKIFAIPRRRRQNHKHDKAMATPSQEFTLATAQASVYRYTLSAPTCATNDHQRPPQKSHNSQPTTQPMKKQTEYRRHAFHTLALRLLFIGCVAGAFVGCTVPTTTPDSEMVSHDSQPHTAPISTTHNDPAEHATQVAPYEGQAETHITHNTMPTGIAPVLDLRQPVPPFTPRTIQRASSRWVAVPWDSLPGLHQDHLHGAIGSLLQSCQASRTALPQLCAEAQTMQYASADQQLKWLQIRLQPYRIQSRNGNSKGLLTAYYEPVLQASRLANAQFNTPLYSPPANLGGRRWHSRKAIETDPRAMQALQGRELVYLSSPIDALILHIQGSGKVLIAEPDGSINQKRMAFAGTNNHRYRSVASKLLRSKQISGASWQDIRAWADASSPQAVQQALWSNPRYVFFKEEPLDNMHSDLGPRGAQGVPLSAGRSIAVDTSSIPYGTPLWLASSGSAATIRRFVVAQDTGNAIRGAVRADYFAGSGDAAGAFAGNIKQPLALWALWPR